MRTLLLLSFLCLAPTAFADGATELPAGGVSRFCCNMFLDGEPHAGSELCRASLEEARSAASRGMTGNDLESRCRTINRNGFGRTCTVDCYEN